MLTEDEIKKSLFYFSLLFFLCERYPVIYPAALAVETAKKKNTEKHTDNNTMNTKKKKPKHLLRFYPTQGWYELILRYELIVFNVSLRVVSEPFELVLTNM